MHACVNHIKCKIHITSIHILRVMAIKCQEAINNRPDIINQKTK